MVSTSTSIQKVALRAVTAVGLIKYQKTRASRGTAGGLIKKDESSFIGSRHVWTELSSNGKKHGIRRIWNSNGQLNYEEKYHQGNRFGVWRGWYNSGELWFEERYHQGYLHGIRRVWGIYGRLALRASRPEACEENYYQGNLHGMRFTWHSLNGELMREQTYANGFVINEKVY